MSIIYCHVVSLFIDTVRKGITDITSFNGTEELAMIGSLSALSGTGLWLIVATFVNLPVSGTHSVVGATMGYALVAHGISGVKWKTFGLIGEILVFNVHANTMYLISNIFTLLQSPK